MEEERSPSMSPAIVWFAFQALREHMREADNPLPDTTALTLGVIWGVTAAASRQGRSLWPLCRDKDVMALARQLPEAEEGSHGWSAWQ